MKSKKQSLILLLLLWIAISQAIGEDDYLIDTFNLTKIYNTRAGDIVINKRSFCGVMEDRGTETALKTTITESNSKKQMKRDLNEVLDKDVSRDNKIELLVVVTTRLENKFGNDLEPFILENIGIASRLFRHPSMKHSIKIEIVKIITIDRNYENEQDLDDWSKLKMEVVLHRFCDWVKLKKSDWNFKFDSALLMDYGRRSDGVGGIARLNSMCSNDNCQAVIGSGFDLGNIIAHELAHQLGSHHDLIGNEICRQFESTDKKKLTTKTVMRAGLSAENYPLVWSDCSSNSIGSFLRKAQSSCLIEHNQSPNLFSHDDIVKNLRKFNFRQKFDFNQQCSLLNDEQFIHVSNYKRFKCSILMCKKRGFAIARFISTMLADGTQCDRNKHCVAGECLDKNSTLIPINGGWSKFRPWTKCSRSCGWGRQTSRRICDNPKPSMGGAYCLGTRNRLQSCYKQACSQPQSSKAEICHKNNLVVRISTDHPCQRICKSHNGRVNNKIFLPDGSSCNRRLSGICYKGICLNPGKDQQEIDGSALRESSGEK